MARYFTRCMILAAFAVSITAIGYAQECKKGDDACIKKTPVCIVQGKCSQKDLDKANGKTSDKGKKDKKKGKS